MLDHLPTLQLLTYDPQQWRRRASSRSFRPSQTPSLAPPVSISSGPSWVDLHDSASRESESRPSTLFCTFQADHGLPAWARPVYTQSRLFDGKQGEIDVRATLSKSNFPVKPEELVKACKDFLSSGLGTKDGSLIADDFLFCPPVVMPLSEPPFPWIACCCISFARASVKPVPGDSATWDTSRGRIPHEQQLHLCSSTPSNSHPLAAQPEVSPRFQTGMISSASSAASNSQMPCPTYARMHGVGPSA